MIASSSSREESTTIASRRPKRSWRASSTSGKTPLGGLTVTRTMPSRWARCKRREMVDWETARRRAISGWRSPASW